MVFSQDTVLNVNSHFTFNVINILFVMTYWRLWNDLLSSGIYFTSYLDFFHRYIESSFSADNCKTMGVFNWEKLPLVLVVKPKLSDVWMQMLHPSLINPIYCTHSESLYHEPALQRYSSWTFSACITQNTFLLPIQVAQRCLKCAKGPETQREAWPWYRLVVCCKNGYFWKP